MVKNTFQYFECNNPGCRLRFPSPKASPRRILCPVCRSTITVVDTIITESERDNVFINPPNKRLSVFLDNIRSAWNVGSIFRTSDGFGIDKIYCCGITPTPDNTKVAKTSLGSETDIRWEHANNGLIAAQKLKSQGYLLISLEDLPNSQSLYSFEIPSDRKTILVLGNEVVGIDPGIIDISDAVVSIPMVGKKRSHNVAMAFAAAASFLYYRQIVSQESRRIFPST